MCTLSQCSYASRSGPLRTNRWPAPARRSSSSSEPSASGAELGIYRWLFGDEALFLAGMEMRVEAGLQMLDNHDPSPVHVPHPETGELVLVTREEILEHAEADSRVLDADVRYEERQRAGTAG